MQNTPSSVLLSLNLNPPFPLQDSVLLRDELVSHADVPLLLVLRHRRHGDRQLHLQVHRVCGVSDSLPLFCFFKSPLSSQRAKN